MNFFIKNDDISNIFLKKIRNMYEKMKKNHPSSIFILKRNFKMVILKCYQLLQIIKKEFDIIDKEETNFDYLLGRLTLLYKCRIYFEQFSRTYLEHITENFENDNIIFDQLKEELKPNSLANPKVV